VGHDALLEAFALDTDDADDDAVVGATPSEGSDPT
jgi:hypothetical protein